MLSDKDRIFTNIYGQRRISGWLVLANAATGTARVRSWRVAGMASSRR